MSLTLTLSRHREWELVGRGNWDQTMKEGSRNDKPELSELIDF
jgi:hypothetical protein